MSKLADLEMAQGGEEPKKALLDSEDIREEEVKDVLADGKIDIVKFNELVRKGKIDDEETIKGFYKAIRARDFTSAVIIGGFSGILGALALPFTGVKLFLLKMCERKDLQIVRERNNDREAE